jgi:superfamily II DNA/RNA helicase
VKEDVSSDKWKDGFRIENLQKFRDADEDSVPALVCTDLAARGLDLVCDHVINFDFPLNPVSYILTCCFSIFLSAH